MQNSNIKLDLPSLVKTSKNFSNLSKNDAKISSLLSWQATEVVSCKTAFKQVVGCLLSTFKPIPENENNYFTVTCWIATKESFVSVYNINVRNSLRCNKVMKFQALMEKQKSKYLRFRIIYPHWCWISSTYKLKCIIFHQLWDHSSKDHLATLSWHLALAKPANHRLNIRSFESRRWNVSWHQKQFKTPTFHIQNL